MGIKNQMDIIAITNLTAMDITILWSTMVLLAGMTVTSMLILDCHTIAILMLITHIQVPTIHIIIME
jgi:hypothetical protein